MEFDKQKYDELALLGCSSYEYHWDIFKEVLEITKPKEILEIGMYRGSSAALFLCGSDANLTSVDPIFDTTTNISLIMSGRGAEIPSWQPQFDAVKKIKDTFGERFNFISRRSCEAFVLGELSTKKYDLCFCDGDHWRPGVDFDIRILLNLKVPYILFDDFHLQVTEAFNDYEQFFEVIKYYPAHKNFPKEGQPPSCLVKNKII